MGQYIPKPQTFKCLFEHLQRLVIVQPGSNLPEPTRHHPSTAAPRETAGMSQRHRVSFLLVSTNAGNRRRIEPGQGMSSALWSIKPAWESTRFRGSVFLYGLCRTVSLRTAHTADAAGFARMRAPRGFDHTPVFQGAGASVRNVGRAGVKVDTRCRH